MQMPSDAPIDIRSSLVGEIERLERDCRAMTLPALHEAIDQIRILASDHGLLAIEGIARAFERSVIRDRQATAFALYFDQLKFAAVCGRPGDVAVRDAMLAAISVRLAG